MRRGRTGGNLCSVSASTLHISVDVAIADGQIRGHVFDGAAPRRPFSGWLGLIAALDELIGRPGAPGPQRPQSLGVKFGGRHDAPPPHAPDHARRKPHPTEELSMSTLATEAMIRIGDTAPDFEAETTEGRVHLHEWMGDSWVVLFSHPKDFTPVCTTELGYMARIKPEFDKRNVKIIGLSVDPVEEHASWAGDIEATQGSAPNYPIIGDADYAVSKLYGMLPASTEGDPSTRTPADNQTVRNVYLIGPDKRVKLILVYPMTTGRNFDEVLRVIDSIQLTAEHKVSTPVNWKHGEDVIIAGSVNDDEAKELFGDWESPRPYIRIVPQPN
jgi:thioredoxin-dependent peroxiredoxin